MEVNLEDYTYFDKDKNPYDLKTLREMDIKPVSFVSNTVWQNYVNTNKWDIINGKFVDISNTQEWLKENEQQNRNNILFNFEELYFNLMDCFPVIDEFVLNEYEYDYPFGFIKLYKENIPVIKNVTLEDKEKIKNFLNTRQKNLQILYIKYYNKIIQANIEQIAQKEWEQQLFQKFEEDFKNINMFQEKLKFLN